VERLAYLPAACKHEYVGLEDVERNATMYTLISRLPLRELLVRQAPALFGALVIAEMFYKWHSFLLEAGGFLVTWFVLDVILGVITKAFGLLPEAENKEMRAG
jgi:hypothetical protein